MKKLLSLLLVLMMVLSGAAFADAADYVGYWVMTGIEMDGVTVDPTSLGMSSYLELYEDGTCLMVMLTEGQYGTWVTTETGIETTDADGIVDAFTLVDGALVIEEAGNKLIFTAEQYTMPLTGLSMEAFNGEWEFAYLEYSGGIYYAEEVGMSMHLSLKDGQGVHTAIYTDETGEVNESFNGVCTTEEVAGFGTALYFIYTDETGAATDMGLALLLFDNGELVWYAADESGMVLYYCFVKAE